MIKQISIFHIAALIVCAVLINTFSLKAQEVPSFEDVLSMPRVGSPIISPDGKLVAYTVRKTDWDNNRYDTEIWLAKDGMEPFQLTNTNGGNSGGHIWSPDGKWIAFSASRDGSSQIHAIRADGGEAIQITHEKGSIGQFDFSPDGQYIAYTRTPEDSPDDEERSEKYGAYAVDDEEYKMTGLYLMEFDPLRADPSEMPCYEETDSLKKLNCIQRVEPVALIDTNDFTVSGFLWSPDGKHIAFNKGRDPLRNSWFFTDIAMINIESKEITDLVTNAAADFCVEWSPDGSQLLYSSDIDNFESAYYTNNRLFILKMSDTSHREVGADFDEDISVQDWTSKGIYFTAWQKTNRHVFLMNPDDGSITPVFNDDGIIARVSFADDGVKAALLGRGYHEIYDIMKGDFGVGGFEDITHQQELIEDWKVAQSEVISWPSDDGAEIEGVLYKPADYDPNKKYPLLVVIHGGPTGISLPNPTPGSWAYPIVQWLDKGAVVLSPNYRGSAGYGADFRRLNVRNLGVGDAWDVLSGVEYLDAQGIIDTSRMGCMGWSQGGYISAFLTTNSDVFQAISVGAGISNWMTYYVNTDIHPFTRQYLKATPWSDKEIYDLTSPMTNINQASTPTLIQHGENDQRVPIANAYELAQGLRDVGVDTRLIVYKGFGHGISKPKEGLAVLQHNWDWFNKYVFED